MGTEEKILKLLKAGHVAGSRIADLLGLSRQAVHHHLKKLVLEGRVVKEGRTRGAAFRLASGAEPDPARRPYEARYTLGRVEEDRIFSQVARNLNLKPALRPESWEIAQYAFTEMMNNAIDHSGSRECKVRASLRDYDFRFTIRDYGIGVFASIAGKLELQEEEEALGELIQGKTTTMPEAHSGEGIFFTSKAADTLTLRSHRLEVLFDNQKEDVFISRKRNLRGTEVRFSVSRNTRRKLQKVFEEFAPAEFDYRFERTRVLVKLFKEAYVSRSEAKRLLVGMEKFREVILDFRGVKSLGQGFADEVFRVFRNRHPGIEIRTTNLDPVLSAALRHVLDNSK